MKFRNDLTQEYLKSILKYEPETGLWFWLIQAGLNVGEGSIAGSIQNGYLVIGIDCKVYMAHRLAHLYMTGKWPENEVDHENRIRSDCRWENIRNAKHNQNQYNAKVKSNSKSGIKGIRLKYNKWESRIRINGKPTHLGYFSTPEEAHEAYLKAAIANFGEFASDGKAV